MQYTNLFQQQEQEITNLNSLESIRSFNSLYILWLQKNIK